ncbi:MAG: Gfo/Idh/MocA family oxidoreductase [Gemmatimonadaceae bacterium]|nr:Gfo/Idh/MocA family oxidoreductase [Gemmatimonadaceae bacterium]NUQ91335.1 Gfo/Idh/MocA family oxidoreductase [Gemmatimonadaceae bacterium]NUR18531.1 Gfo/Idh/MocA family oxidoreductase [Gemmatimonadaceae bacterium]NUS97537.1 Gfo/Idh/MocA family oxidoreductase [Gemmatimonadaceae bacterium]
MSKHEFTRRDFLGATAVAAGASIAAKTIRVPAPLFAQQRTVAPSDRVRFGMVGVGMQGSGLLATSIQIPGVECAGAADLYDGRHVLAREIVRADLPVTRRYQQLLDDKSIDCIVAAVPDHWHRRIVVDAVSAGKDIYCEKPMSHTAADGVAMVAAAKKSGRIVQIGSQRVSSNVVAKAREMVASGTLGDLMLVEGWLGRNSPTGAWEYPPPSDLSTKNLDWDTWQGDVTPKRALDPNVFARWRCWKEYGTGVAGDLLVHLISGMMAMLDINEAPRQAFAVGGIRHWKDGRNMPDVHATNYYYGDLPVYMRLNLATEMPETYRIQGSKGILEVRGDGLTFTPQSGNDDYPSYYAYSFPKAMRDAYFAKWHAENDARVAKEATSETITFHGRDYDDVEPHLANFFNAVRSRKPVVEDVVFGHHAALACHMANESYFRKNVVTWDEGRSAILG